MKRGSPLYRRYDGPRYDRSTYQDDEISLFTHPSKKTFLEREVKQDDTLQSIALEFNVSVGELKRVNNIHKENEIYARRILRIPAKPHSLLIETEDVVDKPSSSSHVTTFTKNYDILTNINLDVEPTKQLDDDDDNSISYKSSSINTTDGLPTCYFQPIEAEKFQNLEINETESSNLLQDTQVTEMLPDLVNNNKYDVLSCNGADCGISWPLLVILALLVVVGGPVYYVWFLWENNELKHS